MIEPRWNCPSMDDWQIEIVEFTKNIITNWDKRSQKENNFLINLILMCGRQVGKSEIIAYCIAMILLNLPNQKILIISGVERQASGLYNKVLYLLEKIPNALKIKKDKPLRTRLKLRNGSELLTEPVGLDGSGARQWTLTGIVFEEMQLIPEAAYAAITPMLFTTGGFIWMLGTAWATEGYVYERLSDHNFKVIRVNSEEVAEKRPEPSRSMMLKFLEEERKRLSEAYYAQEYLAIPMDNKLRRLFPEELIKKVCVGSRAGISPSVEYVCGVDPAGLGMDEGSISILAWDENTGKLTQTEHIITEKLYTTQTTDRILALENLYNFKKIYVDDGGVGFGVFSELLAADGTKYKTISLNNSSRPLDFREEKEKKILGDEMVFNLLFLMERGDITLLSDSAIKESLRSYQFEKDIEHKTIKINSNYNHPVQSIMRAAWHNQTKDLKLEVHSIKV